MRLRNVINLKVILLQHCYHVALFSTLHCIICEEIL